MQTTRRRRRRRRFGVSVPFAPAMGLRLRGTSWSMSKVASALLVVMLALALFQLSDNYAFFIYDADIQGHRLLSREWLYATSEVHESSIFWLVPRQISSRLEAHPYVKQAIVHSRLPGEVTIEVKERMPCIVWLSNGGEHWIDTEAMTLPPLAAGRPSLVLVDDEGHAGREDGALQPGVAEGIILVSRLMPEVSEFRYDDNWGLLFKSPGGWHVALGEADRMRLKVETLRRIEGELGARGEHPQLVDLRFPDAPYYR